MHGNRFAFEGLMLMIPLVFTLMPGYRAPQWITDIESSWKWVVVEEDFNILHDMDGESVPWFGDDGVGSTNWLLMIGERLPTGIETSKENE